MMVRNEVSPQADGYGNAAIDSGDSYSFSQNTLSPLRMFAARIEVPPYGLGKQLLFLRSRPAYEEYMASRIKQHVEIGMAFVDRPLTQLETDSFVEQAVSLTTKPRIGAYLGSFLGFLLVTKPFFKNGRPVPFSQMKGMVDRPLIIKTLLWPFCVFAGNIFGKASGASLAVRDLTSDPRLTQYRQDRANQDPQKVQKSLEKLGWKTRHTQSPPRRPHSQQNKPEKDNASRTAGFESNGDDDSIYSSAHYGPSSEIYVMQSQADSNIPEQSNPQQWDPSQRQQGDLGKHRQGRQIIDKSDDDDVFGFNSNTTPATAGSTTTRSQPSGSAWDRLRGSPSSASNRPSIKRESSSLDSTISSTEGTPSDSSSTPPGNSWDRIRAASAFPSSTPFQPQPEQWPQNKPDHYEDSTRQSKDKAQREFDRLLEQERQSIGDGDSYTKRKGDWGRGS
ncbi:hypothetical protein I7I53_00058 [Histoplasma capsulatum var. duboisii H88]|uniref:Endo-1,3(4)-beta-glucanase n=2 Tax=Ajellomyces capsulatus (strain H88) TaxID=544711 RepID=A0A8A1LLU0_AJEC8|nr:hypothetical protein I7I53_00058 [Histoplasma capsulatum var. duboisii H88]